MSLPGIIFLVILIGFIGFVLYNAVKKQKGSKIIPGGGGTYPPFPTPTVTENLKPKEPELVEPSTEDNNEELSPETRVILPEATPTPKVKDYKKKEEKKKEEKRKEDKKKD